MPRSLRRAIPPAIVALVSLPAAAMAEGMPQLNFNNPLTLDQVGWGAVIFVIFFLLCWKWGLPQVQRVLDQRADAIAADLDAARAVKSEADVAMRDMTETTARARAEAQGAINAAVDKAKREAADRAAALDAQLDARLKDSEQRIAAAQTSAMRALRTVATDAATALIARLTASTPDSARVERAVGTALAARGQG
ncbi:MAG: F0F1 ATP synthase subunit B' [Acetobacteraceae bacterium]|nr:F0F1 ATP synthase subunit B' [Acetobacteraceae bacterium]MBV8869879.1 F0F1 ATP synthase subunit B' [Acetobacteraceae bacterium]